MIFMSRSYHVQCVGTRVQNILFLILFGRSTSGTITIPSFHQSIFGEQPRDLPVSNALLSTLLCGECSCTRETRIVAEMGNR